MSKGNISAELLTGRGIPLLAIVLCALYIVVRCTALADSWFDPFVTTDDARQQSFMFHDVTTPGVFAGDLITRSMSAYLAPLHYGLTYAVTSLTHNPVMSGHWLMALQLTLIVIFLFLAVRAKSRIVPAAFAVIWFIHTSKFFRASTGGLPRGWVAPIIAAFLYFLFTKNHRGVLVTLFLGCLLNPPATFLISLCYGLFLCGEMLRKQSRGTNTRPLLVFLTLCPLYASLSFWVVQREPDIGSMVSLEQASTMPEFSSNGGRFPFLPFMPVWDEIKQNVVHAYTSRVYEPSIFVAENVHWIAIGLLLSLVVLGAVQRRELIPSELLYFLLAIVIAYSASRIFAFRLYVPNRYLQVPLGIFIILATTIGLWRSCQPGKSTIRYFESNLTMLLLGALIYLCSGSGIGDIENFNIKLRHVPKAVYWIRDNTAKDVTVAGDPDLLDEIQLAGRRKGYITTETAHPFYDAYAAEVRRRLEVVWRAYLETDIAAFHKRLADEGIDYFVFDRPDFHPTNLPKLSYLPPHDALIAELRNEPTESYVYYRFRNDPTLRDTPVVPFDDSRTFVVDVRELGGWLEDSPERRIQGELSLAPTDIATPNVGASESSP